MTPHTLIHDVLPPAVTHALGYTLLHALWQGALMALLVGVLLRLMHRHSATIRYWVTWSSLMALLLISVVTYGKLYSSNIAAGEVSTVAVMNSEPSLHTIVLKTAPPSFWENALTKGQEYLNQHLPAVVILWLMGMLLMGLRVLGGWVYVQRLRSYRTRAVPEGWQQKAQELSLALGMNQLVQVAESALVQVPMVIGHFKPLILLPLGALTGLSTAQVEAILAHELAHIYRRDYLLNLLQSMVETLFFFHPAVWWISDCARTEREHACDDLALALCGDPLTYAYALTNLEELLMKTNVTPPRLAVAFSGHRSRSLLGRITRLVQKSTLRPSFSEGFLASCAVIAGVLVFSASAWANYTVPANPTQSQEPAQQPAPAKSSFSAAAPQEELELQEEDLTLQQLEDGLVIVQNKKGKVVEVYVNGQRIPKSELGKYQERIQQQLASTKIGKRLRTEEEVSRAMSRVEASLEDLHTGEGFAPPAPPAPMPPMPPTPRAPHAPGLLRAPVPPVPPGVPLAPLPDDGAGNKRYKKAMKEYEARMKEYEAKVDDFSARQAEFQARLQASQETRMADHTRRMEDHNRRLAEHAVRLQEQEKRRAEHEVRMKEHEERREKHDAMMKELMSALVADGLIKSAEADYDFKLSKNGLFVDGKKQSDALFDKYKRIVQATTDEDVELMLKKDGANFTIQSNRNTKKAK
ncbi:M56 family metallopeptidase [Rufibacter sp. XAAS-G3-1]|uniref:M56 family metallopeptidase n=1 Tax=Rufibacter sp. XAAS-G3-1 TaxID=2729134 RepID=UPI0015E7CF8E|nr:M56 family metallopeptidase [Rufibacter sp. XAAS-G3-1]